MRVIGSIVVAFGVDVGVESSSESIVARFAAGAVEMVVAIVDLFDLAWVRFVFVSPTRPF